jgi:hypothetical protein
MNPVTNYKPYEATKIEPIYKTKESKNDLQKNNDGDTVEINNKEYKPSPQPIGPSLFPDKPKSIFERSQNKATDTQIGGDHYKKFKIQPVEFCILNGIGFGEGNVIKYVCRHQFKNGIEDLKKARHYIDLLIQLEYGNENQRLQAKQEMCNLPQEDD